jgi:hypothetical protein
MDTLHWTSEGKCRKERDTANTRLMLAWRLEVHNSFMELIKIMEVLQLAVGLAAAVWSLLAYQRIIMIERSNTNINVCQQRNEESTSGRLSYVET